MDKKNFAFGRMNYILLAIGMVVIILGLILMSGSGSSETTFDADIFSARRIKVAPVICFAGFIFMMYGIMHKPKDK
ncbi:MAG: DUF3098 domain-containing protein [Bacteroidaceae bacterium]|jgi:hypothetical protein|nr:DUF3098 domain-containing protein [Bacteroidaceae bacterium]